MKLHLPSGLRKALLACLAALAAHSFSATVASGSALIGGGAFVSFLLGQQAKAAEDDEADDPQLLDSDDVSQLASYSDSADPASDEAEVDSRFLSLEELMALAAAEEGSYGIAPFAADTWVNPTPVGGSWADTETVYTNVTSLEENTIYTLRTDGGNTISYVGGAGSSLLLRKYGNNYATTLSGTNGASLEVSLLWLSGNGENSSTARNYFYINTANYLGAGIQNIYINLVGLQISQNQEKEGFAANFIIGRSCFTNQELITDVALQIEANVTTGGYLRVAEDSVLAIKSGSTFTVSSLRGSGDVKLYTTGGGKSAGSGAGTLVLTSGDIESDLYTGRLNFVGTSGSLFTIQLGSASGTADITQTVGGLSGTYGAFTSAGSGTHKLVITGSDATANAASNITFGSGVLLSLAEGARQSFTSSTISGGLQLGTNSALSLNSSSLSGGITLGAGSTLTLDVATTVSGALTLTGDATLSLALSENMSFSSFNADGHILTLLLTNFASLGNGTYNLFGSGFDRSSVSFERMVQGHKIAELNEEGQLVVRSAELVWDGGDFTWVDETDLMNGEGQGKGWKLNGESNFFTNSDVVEFNNESGGTVTIASSIATDDMTIANGDWTFNATGGSLSVQGTLNTGAHNVTLQEGTFNIAELVGSGTVTLAGSSTTTRYLTIGDGTGFTGNIAVNSAWTISQDLTLGSTGRITISSTGALTIGAGVTLTGNLSLSRAGSADSDAAIHFGNGATLNGSITLTGNTRFETGSNVTINASLDAGGHDLHAVRTGVITINGAVTNLNTIKMKNAKILITSDLTAASLHSSANGTLTLAMDAGGYNGMLEFAGSVSGITGFVNQDNRGGAGFGGTYNAGILFSGSLTLNADTTFNGVVINNNATVPAFIIANKLLGSGKIIKEGAGLLTITNTANLSEFTGGMEVKAGAVTLNATGASLGDVSVAANATLTLGASATFSTLSGAGTLAAATGATLTVTISNNLTSTSENLPSFTGTIGAGITLNVQSGYFGFGGTLNGTQVSISGGTLGLGSNAHTLTSLNVLGNGTISVGRLENGGNITLSSFTVSEGAKLTILLNGFALEDLLDTTYQLFASAGFNASWWDSIGLLFGDEGINNKEYKVVTNADGSISIRSLLLEWNDEENSNSMEWAQGETGWNGDTLFENNGRESVTFDAAEGTENNVQMSGDLEVDGMSTSGATYTFEVKDGADGASLTVADLVMEGSTLDFDVNLTVTDSVSGSGTVSMGAGTELTLSGGVEIGSESEIHLLGGATLSTEGAVTVESLTVENGDSTIYLGGDLTLTWGGLNGFGNISFALLSAKAAPARLKARSISALSLADEWEDISWVDVDFTNAGTLEWNSASDLASFGNGTGLKISGGGDITITNGASRSLGFNVWVNEGELTLGSEVSSTAGILVSSGSKLTASGSNTLAALEVDGEFALGNNGITVTKLEGSGSITATEARTLTVGSGEFSGTISGTNVSLTKNTEGSLALSGNNISLGTLTISAGSISLTNGMTLTVHQLSGGFTADKLGVADSNGGMATVHLQMDNRQNFAAQNSVFGSKIRLKLDIGTNDIDRWTNFTNISVLGELEVHSWQLYATGNNSIAKLVVTANDDTDTSSNGFIRIGGGTTTIVGDSQLGGCVDITGGTMKIDSSLELLGGGVSGVTGASITGAGNLTVNLNNRLTSIFNNTFTFSGTFDIGGSLTVKSETATNKQILSGGSVNIGGGITVSSGTLEIGGDSGNAVTTTTVSTVAGSSLIVARNLTASGALDAKGSLTVNAGKTLTAASGNVYGALTLGGTLDLGTPTDVEDHILIHATSVTCTGDDFKIIMDLSGLAPGSYKLFACDGWEGDWDLTHLELLGLDDRWENFKFSDGYLSVGEASGPEKWWNGAISGTAITWSGVIWDTSEGGTSHNAAFHTYDTISFNGRGDGTQTVNVAGDVQAGRMQIVRGSYRFVATTSGTVLTVNGQNLPGIGLLFGDNAGAETEFAVNTIVMGGVKANAATVNGNHNLIINGTASDTLNELVVQLRGGGTLDKLTFKDGGTLVLGGNLDINNIYGTLSDGNTAGYNIKAYGDGDEVYELNITNSKNDGDSNARIIAGALTINERVRLQVSLGDGRWETLNGAFTLNKGAELRLLSGQWELTTSSDHTILGNVVFNEDEGDEGILVVHSKVKFTGGSTSKIYGLDMRGGSEASKTTLTIDNASLTLRNGGLIGGWNANGNEHVDVMNEGKLVINRTTDSEVAQKNYIGTLTVDGTSSLTKQGSGKQTLGTVNAAGAVNVEAGTLKMTSLNLTGTTTVAPDEAGETLPEEGATSITGGRLTVTNSTATVTDKMTLSGNSSADITGALSAGSLDMEAGTTLHFHGGGTLTGENGIMSFGTVKLAYEIDPTGNAKDRVSELILDRGSFTTVGSIQGRITKQNLRSCDAENTTETPTEALATLEWTYGSGNVGYAAFDSGLRLQVDLLAETEAGELDGLTFTQLTVEGELALGSGRVSLTDGNRVQHITATCVRANGDTFKGTGWLQLVGSTAPAELIISSESDINNRLEMTAAQSTQSAALHLHGSLQTRGLTDRGNHEGALSIDSYATGTQTHYGNNIGLTIDFNIGEYDEALDAAGGWTWTNDDAPEDGIKGDTLSFKGTVDLSGALTKKGSGTQVIDGTVKVHGGLNVGDTTAAGGTLKIKDALDIWGTGSVNGTLLAEGNTFVHAAAAAADGGWNRGELSAVTGSTIIVHNETQDGATLTVEGTLTASSGHIEADHLIIQNGGAATVQQNVQQNGNVANEGYLGTKDLQLKKGGKLTYNGGVLDVDYINLEWDAASSASNAMTYGQLHIVRGRTLVVPYVTGTINTSTIVADDSPTSTDFATLEWTDSTHAVGTGSEFGNWLNLKLNFANVNNAVTSMTVSDLTVRGQLELRHGELVLSGTSSLAKVTAGQAVGTPAKKGDGWLTLNAGATVTIGGTSDINNRLDMRAGAANTTTRLTLKAGSSLSVRGLTDHATSGGTLTIASEQGANTNLTIDFNSGEYNGVIDAAAGWTNGNTLTYNGSVTLTGKLTKRGSGTQIIGGAVTVGTGVEVLGGTLKMTSDRIAGDVTVGSENGGQGKLDWGNDGLEITGSLTVDGGCVFEHVTFTSYQLKDNTVNNNVLKLKSGLTIDKSLNLLSLSTDDTTWSNTIQIAGPFTLGGGGIAIGRGITLLLTGGAQDQEISISGAITGKTGETTTGQLHLFGNSDTDRVRVTLSGGGTLSQALSAGNAELILGANMSVGGLRSVDTAKESFNSRNFTVSKKNGVNGTVNLTLDVAQGAVGFKGALTLNSGVKLVKKGGGEQLIGVDWENREADPQRNVTFTAEDISVEGGMLRVQCGADIRGTVSIASASTMSFWKNSTLPRTITGKVSGGGTLQVIDQAITLKSGGAAGRLAVGWGSALQLGDNLEVGGITWVGDSKRVAFSKTANANNKTPEYVTLEVTGATYDNKTSADDVRVSLEKGVRFLVDEGVCQKFRNSAFADIVTLEANSQLELVDGLSSITGEYVTMKTGSQLTLSTINNSNNTISAEVRMTGSSMNINGGTNAISGKLLLTKDNANNRSSKINITAGTNEISGEVSLTDSELNISGGASNSFTNTVELSGASHAKVTGGTSVLSGAVKVDADSDVSISSGDLTISGALSGVEKKVGDAVVKGVGTINSEGGKLTITGTEEATAFGGVLNFSGGEVELDRNLTVRDINVNGTASRLYRDAQPDANTVLTIDTDANKMSILNPEQRRLEVRGVDIVKTGSSYYEIAGLDSDSKVTVAEGRLLLSGDDLYVGSLQLEAGTRIQIATESSTRSYRSYVQGAVSGSGDLVVGGGLLEVSEETTDYSGRVSLRGNARIKLLADMTTGGLSTTLGTDKDVEGTGLEIYNDEPVAGVFTMNVAQGVTETQALELKSHGVQFVKTGAGTQELAEFTADSLLVKEGVLRLTAGSERDKVTAFTGNIKDLTVDGAGALLKVERRSWSAQETNVTLSNGGTVMMPLTPLQLSDKFSIDLGALTVTGEGNAFKWGENVGVGGETKGLVTVSFSKLTGDGELKVDSFGHAALDTAVQGRRLHFEAVENFRGTLSADTVVGPNSRISIGQVTQEQGVSGELNVGGGVYSGNFRKLGEGELILSGLTSIAIGLTHSLYMDYTGTLSLGKDGLHVTNGAMLHYSVGDGVKQLEWDVTELEGLRDGVDLQIGEVLAGRGGADRLRTTGICLGIVGVENYTAAQLEALREKLTLWVDEDEAGSESEWSIFEKEGKLWLLVENFVAAEVPWDEAWSPVGGLLRSPNSDDMKAATIAPEDLAKLTAPNGQYNQHALSLAAEGNAGNYADGSNLIIKLTDGSDSTNTKASIIGGALQDGESLTVTEANTYILLAPAEGKSDSEVRYHLLVGGSSCLSTAAGQAGGHSGNSHIQMEGGTVDYIVGGNHVTNSDFSFTGNSYISVMSGDVRGGIVGGSTITAGARADRLGTDEFSGSSYIFIYTALRNTTAPVISAGAGVSSGAFTAVVGGNAWVGLPTGADAENMAPAFRGNSHITLDMKEVKAGSFEKDIVGGNFITAQARGEETTADIFDGSTEIIITNVSDEVRFTGSITGASRRASGGAGSVVFNGSTSIRIHGGSYAEAVVGGMRFDEKAGGAHSGQFTGDTQVSISGGSFRRVVGGSYSLAGGESAQLHSEGNTAVSIEGGVFGSGAGAAQTELGFVAGGDFYRSTGGTHSRVGSSSVSISGGSFSGVHIVGGDYVNFSGADGSITAEGTASVSLSGGEVTGLLAGGSYLTDEGSGGSVSAQNTSVSIREAAVLTAESSENHRHTGIAAVAGHVVVDLGSGAHTATTGASTLSLEGGAVQGHLVGGSYVNDAAAVNSLSTAAVSISLTGGTVAGNVYGGHYAEGAAELELGSVSLTLDGAAVEGDLLGGSYGAAASVKQGSITLNLISGSLTGNVYAAGANTGTTESVVVSVGTAVQAGSGKTISGGYAVSGGSVRSALLAFDAQEAYTNLNGVNWTSFDTVRTAAEVTLKGSFRAAGSLTKTGAGELTLAKGLSSLSGKAYTGHIQVNDGVLALGANQALRSIGFDLTSRMGRNSRETAFLQATGSAKLTGSGGIDLSITHDSKGGKSPLRAGFYYLTGELSLDGLTNAEPDVAKYFNYDENTLANLDTVSDLTANLLFVDKCLVLRVHNDSPDAWYWEGGESNSWNNHSADSWTREGSTLAEDVNDDDPTLADVHFNAGALSEDVEVDGIVTPHDVIVESGDFTFTAGKSGGSIHIQRGGKLIVGSGIVSDPASLTIELDNDIPTVELNASGTLVLSSARAINKDAAVDFNGGLLVVAEKEGKLLYTADLSHNVVAQDAEGAARTGVIRLQVGAQSAEGAAPTLAWGSGESVSENEGLNRVLNHGIEKSGRGVLAVHWQAADSAQHEGSMNVLGGTLQLTADAAADTTTTLAGQPIRVAEGATVQIISAKSGTLELARAISGSGSAIIGSAAGSGAYSLSADNSGFAGSLELLGDSAAAQVSVADAAALGSERTSLKLSGRHIRLTGGQAVLRAGSVQVTEGTANYVGGLSLSRNDVNAAIELTGAITGSGVLANATGGFHHTLSGDVSGFTGTLAAGAKSALTRSADTPDDSTWTLTGAGESLQANLAGNGLVDIAMAAAGADSRLTLTGKVGDAALGNHTSLRNSSAATLVLADGGKNTSTGALILTEGAGGIRIGVDKNTTGSWVGSVEGAGELRLVSGSISALPAGGTAKSVDLVADVAAGAQVNVNGTAGSRFSAITVNKGGHLNQVSGTITADTLGVAGTTVVKLVLDTPNLGAAPSKKSGDYLISMTEGGSMQVAEAAGFTVDVSNEALFDLLVKFRTDEQNRNRAYMHILSGGELSFADSVSSNLGSIFTAGGNASILTLLKSFRLDQEAPGSGDLILTGISTNVYLIIGPDTAQDSKSDSRHITEWNALDGYVATVVDHDATLHIDLDHHNADTAAGDTITVNNLVGLEDSVLRGSNGMENSGPGATVTIRLNNSALADTAMDSTGLSAVEGVSAEDLRGVDTTFLGTIQGEVFVNFDKTGKGTLTVGSAETRHGGMDIAGELLLSEGAVHLEGDRAGAGNEIGALVFNYSAAADEDTARGLTLSAGSTTVRGIAERGSHTADNVVSIAKDAEMLLISYDELTLASTRFEGAGALTVDATVLTITGEGDADARISGLTVSATNNADITLADGAGISGGSLAVEGAGVTLDRSSISGAAVRVGEGGTLTMVNNAVVDTAAAIELAEGSATSVESGSKLLAEGGLVLDGLLQLHDTTGHIITGLTGSGTLRGHVPADEKDTAAAALVLHGDSSQNVFSGTLDAAGKISLAKGDGLTLQGVSRGLSDGAWDITNFGADLRIDITGHAKSSLGTLHLGSGSITTIIFNTDEGERMGNLDLENFTWESGSKLVLENTALKAFTGTTLDLGRLTGKLSAGELDISFTGGIMTHFNHGSIRQENGHWLIDLVEIRENAFVTPGMEKNARAGGDMLWSASADTSANWRRILANDPEQNSDLYKVVMHVKDLSDNPEANEAEMSRVNAAAAGSSISVLGAALAQDMERQLSAIRNRSTAVETGRADRNLHIWMNGEGAYRKLNADGFAPGYSLSGWGGTVGMDMSLSPSTSVGLALSALYGNLKTDAADSGRGDMDTTYATIFARVAKGAWIHTLLLSGGVADISLDRTVRFGGDSYTAKGSTDGYTVGAFYELGYASVMNAEGTFLLQSVFNVALRHASISGYTESGTDAGITADSATYTAFTVGAGARMQALLGAQALNRSALLEARFLLKADAGDRSGKVQNDLTNGNNTKRELESAQIGAVGIELGAGITLPVGKGGSIFVDTSLELRAGYTAMDANIGYRVSF